MKLVVGLGNPGPKYAHTRHNVGFRVVDLLAKRHGVSFSPNRWQAMTARCQVDEVPCLLVKPMTYMNLSGEAVGPLARFYKVPPEAILLVYDDMDLPLGTLRMRPKGSPGGHKGVASVIQHLGTTEIPRLRIGIGRPPGGMDPAAYVLAPFSEEEEAIIAGVVENAADAVECWLTKGLEAAMNWVNARGRPPVTVTERNTEESCRERG